MNKMKLLIIPVLLILSLSQVFSEENNNIPEIRMGILSDFPPYFFTNSKGEIEGLGVQILKRLSVYGNYRYRIVPYQTRDQGLAALEKGDIDCFALTGHDGSSNDNFDYSYPIWVTSVGFFARSGDNREFDLMQNSGLSVAVVRGTVTESYVSRYTTLNKVIVNSLSSGLQALITSEVDLLFFGVEPVIKQAEIMNINNMIKKIGGADVEIKRVFVFKKGEQFYRNILEDAIIKYKQSEYFLPDHTKWLSPPKSAVTVKNVVYFSSGLIIFLMFIGVMIYIIRVRKINRELAELNQRFDLAISGSNDGLWDWDIIKGKLFMSERWKQQIGYGRDELEDRVEVFIGCIYEEDRSIVEDSINKYKSGALDRHDIEFRMIRKEGTIIWIKSRGVALRDRSGRLLRISGSHTDITTRKNYEMELILNEVRLKSIAELLSSSVDSIQEFIDKSLEECLSVTKSRFGYIYFYDEDTAVFTLNSWSKEVMPQCRVANPQTKYELNKTGLWGEAVRQRKSIIINDFDADNPFKKGYPEGHVKLNKFLTIPVYFENKIVAVVGVANKEDNYTERDILELQMLMDGVWRETQRRSIRDKLSFSENKFRTLFNSMSEMVVIHEMIYNQDNIPVDYKITDCNFAYTRVTGLTKELVIGKSGTEVYNINPPPYMDIYERVARTGVNEEISIYYPPMDKHFLISVVSPVKGSFATVTLDITDIKNAEKTLISKNKELENYLYVASHDLRSPLVNIQGFSVRISKALDELKAIVRYNIVDNKESIISLIEDDIPKALSFILNNVAKMDVLINGLLRISRTGSVQMNIQEVDVNALIKKVLLSFQYQLDEVSSIVELEDMPDCNGDYNLLDQMFSNLINNSIKYRDKNRPLKIKISGRKEAGRVVYMIEDNGIGISDNNIDKIWGVFYRVDPRSSEQGEGIGLNLVNKIIEKHKGRVWVESQEGVGSCFFVELKD